MRAAAATILGLLLAGSALAGTTLPWTGQRPEKPGGRTGTRPGGRTGTRPGGRTGTRPGGRTGTRPGGRTGTKPGTGASPRRSGGPGAGPAGEPTDEPKPDVKVEKSEDVVILTDGTKIVGTIIAAGQRAVIIIADGDKRERAIKRSEIETFRRGGGTGMVVGYKVEKDTHRGILTLNEEGSEPGTAAVPGPKPAPKPAPKPKPKPKPGPKKPADLGKLWNLMGGKATPKQIGAAFDRNPGWKPAVSGMIRSRKLPPEGRRAFAKFKARYKSDKDFRKGLENLVKKGKLPPEILGVLRAK